MNYTWLYRAGEKEINGSVNLLHFMIGKSIGISKVNSNEHKAILFNSKTGED